MDDRGVARIYRVLDRRSENLLESTGGVQEFMASGRDGGAPPQGQTKAILRQRLDDWGGGGYC